MSDLIAFLATSVAFAQTDITHDYTIMSTRDGDRGEVIYDGATRPFRIITFTDQLRGLELGTFVVLPHARGNISRDMMMMAQARLRP